MSDALVKAFKPTPQQLREAIHGSVPDLITSGLKVLFVGINPGLYSAATRHHFARPGNRFWPTLFAASFTPRIFSPFEERELLPLGIGITNMAARTTAKAEELSTDELVAGAAVLRKKIRKFSPQTVAIVGISAYRIGFKSPRAKMGPQTDKLEGSNLWLLPNPSGLNANYQAADLKKAYSALHRAIDWR